MVHALGKASSLLKPDGVLIDIHPTLELATLEVRIGGDTHGAGVVTEADGGEEYKDADAALAFTVRQGLLRIEREAIFTFVTHADSLATLREHLADAWQDAVIDDVSARAIETLMTATAADKELLLRERVRMTRFRVLPTRDSCEPPAWPAP
jgi:hypothetical protein